ncbi:MAG: aminoglycoside phosphotransferase family protein, partial [Achromobacter sp.]
MKNDHDPRLAQIRNWLESLPTDLNLAVDTLRPASADASFRRYFRLDAGERTLIVMDAPPAHEDCRPFLHVGQLLADAGLNVPKVLAQDLDLGLLLLSDLGEQTYYQRIQDGLSDSQLQTLYREALAALVQLQKASTAGLASYDSARLADELKLFPEWYVQKHHGVTLDDKTANALEKIFALLSASNGGQAQVLVHRDFHSPNLMVCDQPQYGPNP